MECSLAFQAAASRGQCRSHRLKEQTNTHLQGTFLSRFLAITLQHFPIDSQTKNLGCDFIVISHCMSLELHFGVCRRLLVSRGVAVGVSVERWPGLRTHLIYRLLLLVMMHFEFFCKKRTVNQRKCHQHVTQKISGVILVYPRTSVMLDWTSRTLCEQNEVSSQSIGNSLEHKQGRRSETCK